MIYRLAALGGTFDRLHQGHRQLIQTALASADRVMIGVTRPALTCRKQLADLIQPYSIRATAVKNYLSELKVSHRSKIIPLDDAFGPTLTSREIDVLVITSQTRPGAAAINQARTNRALPPLPIIEAPMISDDANIYLSSTRIRAGQVSRNGHTFRGLFHQDIVFSKNQLSELAQIQGDLISADDLTHLATAVPSVVVGDQVTQTFLDQRIPFMYSLIDGFTRRHQPSGLKATAHLPYPNPPGTIMAANLSRLWNYQAIAPGSIIQVAGEEDLLAFVPVLSLPLESHVFYGQPDQGIVMITVSEVEKLRFAKFIDSHFS